MSPILLGIFLAILGQIQAQSSPIGACSCPLPGSEPHENYREEYSDYKKPHENYDDEYSEYKKPHENYGDEYSEYKKPHGKPEPQKGICTTTEQSFASQCWLNLYNDVHGKDAVPAPDSECRRSKCLIPCSIPDFDVGYNPICCVDRKTGNLETLHNICALECAERDVGISYEVLHCGTCDTNCSEIVPKLDCLRPPRGCTLPTTPTPSDCDCSSDIGAFVCAIDVMTQELSTLFDPCGFPCAQRHNPNLRYLYGHGSGKCPCP